MWLDKDEQAATAVRTVHIIFFNKHRFNQIFNEDIS